MHYRSDLWIQRVACVDRCLWKLNEIKCTHIGSFSHWPSVHCQILACVFHWVSPFLSDSWSARFCTFFTSTWWRAIISGCSAKGSISTHSSWWPCLLRTSACCGITSWAGVCIYLLQPSFAPPSPPSIFIIFFWSWSQRAIKGPGPLRNGETRVLAGV